MVSADTVTRSCFLGEWFKSDFGQSQNVYVSSSRSEQLMVVRSCRHKANLQSKENLTSNSFINIGGRRSSANGMRTSRKRNSSHWYPVWELDESWDLNESP